MRKKFKILRKNVDSNYFKADEAKETLVEIFNENSLQIESTHTYKTGAIYKGKWKGGMRHGQGTMIWPETACYEGDWALNQAQGNGKFFHNDGDIYEGDWVNSKAHGKGIYTNKKGAHYEGQWQNDQQHGRGIETWPEGTKYVGDYAKSMKEGYGIYTQADGVRYEGQFLNDKKDGYGIYFWTDGRQYEGWWSAGKQHGLGNFIDEAKQSTKFGLWEFGKRKKWFDEQQVILINQGRLDQCAYFEDPEKSCKDIKHKATFCRPKNFNEQMIQLKRLKSEIQIT